MDAEVIAEALARGYCYPENEKKQVDMYLILAMTKEIQKLQSSCDRRAFEHFVTQKYGHEKLTHPTYMMMMWDAWQTRGNPDMYDELIKEVAK